MTSLIIVLIVMLIINAGLAWYMLSRDKGALTPLWALGVSLLIGIGGAEVAGVVNAVLIPIEQTSLSSLSLPVVLLVSLVPGIGEELLKNIPVLFFISSQKFFDSHRDGVIYFSFSGLSFGLFENIDYAMRGGAAVGMSRIVTLLFFHAATSGIFGYLYYRARHDRAWTSLIVGSFGLMLAHASYNFALASVRVIPLVSILIYTIPAGLTILLYIVFRWAQALDRQVATTGAQ